jgi:hypothetical protein
VLADHVHRGLARCRGRSRPEWFVVIPDHVDGVVVRRAADRFFVVSKRSSARREWS